jgi:hypothetical protein
MESFFFLAEATTHILMDLHNGDGLRYEWGAAVELEAALSKRLWLFLQPSVPVVVV